MKSPLPNIKYFSVKSELGKAIKLDPDLSRIVDLVGYPVARKTLPGFSALAKVINSQMLSTQSAAAIWRRIELACNENVSAGKIISLESEALRECGLSARKLEYVRSLASMILSGELNLEAMCTYSDSEIIKSLTSIRGIGVWSAEIYAMFSLGRRNFYPAQDLALQVAIQRYANLPTRPDYNEVDEFSLRWSPHRSAVALLMWKYYGATTLDD